MHRTIAKITALASLMALTIPSIIFLAGYIELTTVKNLMLVATIIWFLSATIWMWKDNSTLAQKSDELTDEGCEIVP